MKSFNLKMFILIVLMSISGNALAYSWGFSNHTSKTLLLYFNHAGSYIGYMNIVKPGDKVTFNWPIGSFYAGFCMWGVYWAEHNPNLKVPNVTQNGGLDMKRVPVPGFLNYPYNNGASPMMGFDEHSAIYHKYPWKLAEIVYLPVPVYQETVRNAAGIGRGIDKFLCTAVALIKIANKGKCPGMFSEIINWLGGLIARSACTNRDFEIFEDDKGAIEFITYLQ